MMCEDCFNEVIALSSYYCLIIALQLKLIIQLNFDVSV